MTNPFILTAGAYLLKATLVSGVLYTYYHWKLRNRPCHRFNRLFLLCIPLLSLAMPFIHLPLPASIWPSAQDAPILPDLHAVTEGDWLETDAAAIPSHRQQALFAWQILLPGAYLLVVITLLYFSSVSCAISTG